LDNIASTTSILNLGPEDLLIAWHVEPDASAIIIKIYERKRFFDNPDPSVNQEQIDQYSICPGILSEALAEIKAHYKGWSRINKAQPTELIGIHNQDRSILYIQFSIDQRYFIYKRCLTINKEMVHEELFGRKHNFRQRALNHEDEQYLISMLRFMPKTKKSISFYPMKTAHGFTKAKRRLSYR